MYYCLAEMAPSGMHFNLAILENKEDPPSMQLHLFHALYMFPHAYHIAGKFGGELNLAVWWSSL